MKKPSRIFLLTLSLAVTAFPALFAQAPDDRPTLELRNLQGQPAKLSDYRGKIVVLNFWATWCVPCRKEMPLLVDLQKRFSKRGVTVIAASADDESSAVQVADFVKRMKLNFPVWQGATISDLRRLGLGEGLPATAIIDRRGVIVHRILGMLEAADVKKRVESLLGDRQ